MARLLSALLTLTLLGPAVASAADHLVPLAEAQARLDERNARRAADQAAVEALLGTPQAREAVRTMGADEGRLARGLATLSDAELRDLAARAEAVQIDPVAGLDRDVNMLLKIFLILAIVILVLQAVD